LSGKKNKALTTTNPTVLLYFALSTSVRPWLPVVTAALAVICGAVYSFRCETVALGQDENRSQHGVWYRKPSPYEYYINTSSSKPDVTDLTDLDWSNNLSGGPGLSSGGDCLDYDDTIVVDGLWKFLRATTMIILLLGGGWTIWMFLCNTICRYRRDRQVSMTTWNVQAVVLGAILMVLQGLGCLFVRTNACESAASEKNCEWSTGLRANAAATILWIVTAVLALWVGPPAVVAVNRDGVTQTVTYQRDPVTGQIVEMGAESSNGPSKENA
jgi:hypothetical protein